MSRLRPPSSATASLLNDDTSCPCARTVKPSSAASANDRANSSKLPLVPSVPKAAKAATTPSFKSPAARAPAFDPEALGPKEGSRKSMRPCTILRRTGLDVPCKRKCLSVWLCTTTSKRRRPEPTAPKPLAADPASSRPAPCTAGLPAEAAPHGMPAFAVEAWEPPVEVLAGVRVALVVRPGLDTRAANRVRGVACPRGS
mmetsp:Transcript_11841/g.33744  ORF Transcript_11841/g.33744 Transcript_11841/m.33744 type:complete len:200 (+) Transcript_11841:674-1273(+)